MGLALVCLLPVAARRLTEYHEANVNPYHSLFYGVLMFSRQPAAHLQRLGLADGADCIGVSAYDERGKGVLQRPPRADDLPPHALHPGPTSRRSSGGWGSSAWAPCRTSPWKYLGKYAEGDPRGASRPPWHGIGTGSEQRVWTAPLAASGANLWSDLKFHAFPTGTALALTLAGFAGFCGWRLRAPGTGGDLALVGLLATLAVVADGAVAMLGEGRHELIKHLYLANLLFDVAAVACLNGVLVWWRERAAVGRDRSRERQITSAKACLPRMNTV